MLKGHTEPRIYTPPLRDLTPDTSLGFAVSEFASDVLGMDLYPWQKWLLVHALEITGDFSTGWTFRFRTILALVARQQGKTALGGVLSLAFLYLLDVPLVLGTSVDLEMAEETWQAAVDMATETPELSAEVIKVSQTNGAKKLVLNPNADGQRREYKVKSATRRARGKSCDLLILDELREHRDFEAWGALTKTTMAKPNAIVWCISNAGDNQSVVLRHLRAKAHSTLGDPDKFADKLLESLPGADESDESDDSLAIFEWSAPPDADPSDRDAWAAANPSLGYGLVTERALKSAYVTDPPDVFRAECLCQWVVNSIQPPFPVDSWDNGKDEKSEIAPDSPLFWGVDVAADRSKASIAVCGMRKDRLYHVELAEYRGGIGWIKTWFEKAASNKKMLVAMQGRGATVSGLVDVLNAIENVEVVECTGRNVSAWSGRLWDAVAASCDECESDTEPLMHITQPALDMAAAVAVTKPLGDGAWTWDRNRSSAEISPLVAATMAYGLATQEKDEPEEKKRVSAYEDHDFILL